MKKTHTLFLVFLFVSSFAQAQITCREFEHDPVSNTKAQMAEKKFSLEYEYSNKFANDEKNEFAIRLAADSTYNILAVGGKTVKACEVTIFDASSIVVYTSKAKDKKNFFDFSPARDGEYVIQVVITCKTDNCTYVGVFGKPK